MDNEIEISKFVSLRRQELDPCNEDLIEKIEVSSQSIYRWLQYCQYHYYNLVNAAQPVDLLLDRFSRYRRKGENVAVRYVYEANIIAFLNSLHALLDSFPYLLNLFIPKVNDPDSLGIRWEERFVKRYQAYPFYDELLDFLLAPTFNKVKGYVNTAKHKHLIRIANNWSSLEVEGFKFRQPVRSQNDSVRYHIEYAPRQDAIVFVTECHDVLLPQFSRLCRSVVEAKSGLV